MSQTIGMICVLLSLASCGCRSGGSRVRVDGVRQLTFGSGNDTEAVWSPDGACVAFQTDRAGDLDVAILNLADGETRLAAVGQGHACYPAWTHDGGVVYALSHLRETAAQGVAAKSDNGCNLWLWRDGETRRLTHGRWRDYTPSVTRDGRHIYFATTRGYHELGNGGYLARVPLDDPHKAETVLKLSGFGNKGGAVQPSLSPDGRYLLWAQLDTVFSNWRLCAAAFDDVGNFIYLTPDEMSAYAPRWSPDGKWIAFTGFSDGDPAWGVYVTDPRCGDLIRLETGAGNSKSPCWSPDGGSIVFENNRTGTYKLYCAGLRVLDRPAARGFPDTGQDFPSQVVWRMVGAGRPPVLINDHGVTCEADGRASDETVSIFKPVTGLDFGKQAFFAHASFVLKEAVRDSVIVVAGHYPDMPPGWQIFIRANGRACFGARMSDGRFAAVEASEQLIVGTETEILGVRDPDGSLTLYVDGKLTSRVGMEATYCYGTAESISLGGQKPGLRVFQGELRSFSCGRGYPAGVPPRLTRQKLFGDLTK